jgi:hypothetical protein
MMSDDQDIMTAADGGRIPPATNSAGNLIDLLEDGVLGYELYEAMKALGVHIEHVAEASGGKAKGSITLKIELLKEDGVFKVSSDFSTKEPKMPRQKSILWTTEKGDFTRFPPNQRQMFGLTTVRGSGPINNI